MHYWGGAVALWGCEKVEPAELSPKVGQANQARAAAEGAETVSPAQAAWLRFVDRVERGEAVDPSGQYVAKGTKGAVDAAGNRSNRPKFDAATPAFAQRYRLQSNGEVAGQPVGANLGDDGPPLECDGCEGPGQGIPVPYTPSFTSSVNQGGSGYIHDLKIIVGAPGDNSTSEQQVIGAGYTKLNADLNKGAGGAYIYLCFQRDAAQVLNGVEYTYNYAYSGPNEILTAFQTKGSLSTPGDPYFYNIWVPNQNSNVYWGRIDLNQGSGGDYIYSFQAKSPFVPNYIYVQEVGVLSGNSSTIQPPSGWNKYPKDLNEGAGGDFIYFCYR